MRKLWITLALAVGLLVAVAGSADACGHRHKGGGAEGGGCGGGQASASAGGCSSCAWVPMGGDALAWVDLSTGRQLGYYSRATGLYTPYLGGDRWGDEIALTPAATKPGTAVAEK